MADNRETVTMPRSDFDALVRRYVRSSGHCLLYRRPTHWQRPRAYCVCISTNSLGATATPGLFCLVHLLMKISQHENERGKETGGTKSKDITVPVGDHARVVCNPSMATTCFGPAMDTDMAQLAEKMEHGKSSCKKRGSRLELRRPP